MRRLMTEWVVVAAQHHLFAGEREGLISICGNERHPAKRPTPKPADPATFCFRCMQHLQMILNPEKFAPVSGERIWHRSARRTPHHRTRQ